MPATPGEPGVPVQRIIDKAQARRLVAAMLDGSKPELRVRQLKHALVISNPRDPDKGRVYMEYATGLVSHVRPVREDWGILEGHADEDDTGKKVSAARVIEVLTGCPHEAGGRL